MNYARSLLRKWYIIILCAFIGGGALFVEKHVIHPPVMQGGDAYFTSVAILEPVPVTKLDQVEKENTLNTALKMWGNKQKFLDETEALFDYDQFSKGWNGKSQTSKFKWLDDHFVVNALGDGRYEYTFRIKRTDAKNDDYVELHGREYLEAYVHFAKDVAALYVKNPQMTVVDEYHLFEDKNKVTPQQIEMKYIAIGIVLGALIGLIIVSIINYRNRA